MGSPQRSAFLASLLARTFRQTYFSARLSVTPLHALKCCVRAEAASFALPNCENPVLKSLGFPEHAQSRIGQRKQTDSLPLMAAEGFFQKFLNGWSQDRAG